MEKLPRQKYTKEFREQAVRVVIEQELTIPEAAKRLSMSGQTLSNWVFKARHGKLAGIDAHRKPITDLEAETSKLKRELAEARMERDILKKATVSSTGQRNIIQSEMIFGGDVHGSNGKTWFVSATEGRALVAMEGRTIAERNRICAREARGLDSRSGFVKRGYRSSNSTTFPTFLDAG